MGGASRSSYSYTSNKISTDVELNKRLDLGYGGRMLTHSFKKVSCRKGDVEPIRLYMRDGVPAKQPLWHKIGTEIYRKVSK